MNCGRINLQERSRREPIAPRRSSRRHRYCEQIMVDPDHKPTNAWTEAFMERYYQSCPSYVDGDEINSITQQEGNPSNDDDLYLTVQTLKFQGDVQENTRPRTSFKYKAPNKETKHRLFVKELVIEDRKDDDPEEPSPVTNSQIGQYLDYANMLNTSRPSTAESNTAESNLINHYNKRKNSQNKSVQVELARPFQKSKPTPTHKNNKIENKPPNLKNNLRSTGKISVEKESTKDNDNKTIEDSKISFHKFNKRKSLTISRVQSPETVQVIRVDVVCNYSSAASTISENEESKLNDTDGKNKPNVLEDMKNSRFAHKYLLTKTIKSLDANVSGGAKVTLLCKTFRLANRNKH